MKLNFYILIIGCFSSLSVCSQKSSKDSLFSIWNDSSKNDTVRLKALSDNIWDNYLFYQPDSAFILATNIFNFAKTREISNYQADALNIKGISHAVRGNYSKAISFFQKNMLLAKETKNQSLEAKMATNIANILKDKGQFAEADKYLLEALEVFRKLGDKEHEAITCSNLGISSMQQGLYAQGYDYLERNLNYRIAQDSPKHLTSAYINIGLIYVKQGDDETGLYYLNKGLDVASENNLLREQSSALNNIAAVNARKGKYKEAFIDFSKSLEIYKQIKYKPGISTVYSRIGYYKIKTGNYQEAIQAFDSCLNLQTDLNESSTIALVKGNLGKIYLSTGDSLLNVDKEDAVISYNKSYLFSKEAVQIGNETGYEPAIKVGYTNLYDMAYKLDSMERAFYYLNQILARRELNLKYNFFTLSEREKEIYFNTMRSDYDMFFEFALLNQDSFPSSIDSTFNYVLRNKAITLKSSTALRQQILSSQDSTLINQYQLWLNNRESILSFKGSKTERDSLELVIRDQEKELVKHSEEFKSYEAISNLNWKDVQSSLNKGEAAIEFIHFDNSKTPNSGGIYAALVITRKWEHPKYIRLCTGDDLSNVFNKSSGDNLEITTKIYGKNGALKTELYELIWSPIEFHLKGIKTIYFSPDGILHKISFNAIGVNQDTYLSENYDLHQLIGTGKLKDHKVSSFSNNQSVYLIGGINYNSDTTKHPVWTYLPETLSEVQGIYQELLGRGLTAKQIDSYSANETAVKNAAMEADILHISTHGFFFPNPEEARKLVTQNTTMTDEIAFRGADHLEMYKDSSNNYAKWNFVMNENPLMRSGLVLANANDVWQKNSLSLTDDGVLTAAEVSNLNMQKTSLVVLSACETGLGDIKGSEGVYGLQRSFKMAGVDKLIISLWQVPDKETSLFMTSFYNYLAKYEDVQKAFSEAQKDMREKYDPYFWAAFKLVE